MLEIVLVVVLCPDASACGAGPVCGAHNSEHVHIVSKDVLQ